MTKAIILMTALPPSRGHMHLINFAANYPGIDKVHVIVCSRSFEPISGKDRAAALRANVRNINALTLMGQEDGYVNINTYYSDKVTIHHFEDDVAFQNESDADSSKDFWDFWCNVVYRYANKVEPDDIVFASEKYGIDLAAHLGCRFIPCNLYREVIPISATEIRKNPIKNFKFMAPEFQKLLRMTVTFFGQESCGKTTQSKALANTMNAHWLPEYAREYLEIQLTPEVTDARMIDIENGQYASEQAIATQEDKPFIFRDTDLLSTIGYYRIYGGNDKVCISLFKKSMADLYIVMNDNIPFVRDKLRYGNDERESKKEFWINLLKEFDLPYYEVKSTDMMEQRIEIEKVIMEHFNICIEGWTEFVRT